MQIEIRADKAILEGYVNTVERKSKPLRSRIGQFVEKITKKKIFVTPIITMV